MKKLMLALLVTFMTFCSVEMGHAQEGDWRGGIRARVNVAFERIERGIERGSLTRPEAHRLKRELNHILYKIDHMRRDGYLGPREREIIHRDLDRLDRDITMEKRDFDRRPY